MNWIFKNKKMPCEKSTSEFFCKLKNILHSKKTKTILVVLVLVCVSFGPIAANPCFAITDPISALGKFVIENVFETALKWIVTLILLAFQGFAMVLAAGATVLLEAMLNPDSMKVLMDSSMVQSIWVMVRDIANMFFILVLLFSAFCTIFQVEKWNLKKVWLAILINALLINFSFPIARFFIDISNVAMYYFLNNMFTSALATGTTPSGSAITSSIGTFIGLTDILLPDNFVTQSIMYQVGSVVFTFIFAMTILVLALLFVVRLVALTMLVMFSPIGFVANIFPSTQKFASQWWSMLLSYAFFGPIMVFMIAIALSISKAANNGINYLGPAAKNTLPGTTSITSTYIVAVAKVAIPIIVLWFGMGIAKSFGIAGADTVIGKAKQLGKWASGLKFAEDTYKAYRARRDQAKGDKWSNRLGNWAGNKQDQVRSVLPGGERARNRYQSADSAKVAEEAKIRDTVNMTEPDLQNLARTGNKHAQAAAYQELANRGVTNGAAELDKVRELFGENSQVFKQMQNKVMAYNPPAAFSHIKNKNEREDRIKEHFKSNKYKQDNLSAEAIQDSEFVELMLKHTNIDQKGIIKLTEKSQEHKRNMTNSFNAIATDPTHQNVSGTSPDAELNRKIHLANVSLSGDFSSSLTPAGKDEIISRMDKDSGKNLSASAIGSNAAAIFEKVNPGQFTEIGANLKSDLERKAWVDAVKNYNPGTDPVKIARKKMLLMYIKRNAFLRPHY